jgi:hypothetical protein
MKKIFLMIIIALFLNVVSAKEKKQEATVSYIKKGTEVNYKISFIPGFQYNNEAPFRFNLLDKKKEVVKKIPLTDFKKSEDGSFSFSSGNKEKYVNYWFVACKYVDGQITGCKTFTDTLEIK